MQPHLEPHPVSPHRTGMFRLAENGTTVRTEVLAGVTTFATMAYIVFVQPAVLGAAGMDRGAVFTSTCLATALGTILMAVLANYPVAVAPAMGHNFFFAYTVVLAMGIPWQQALGAVFVSGVVFVLTSSFGLRERIVQSVPDSLKSRSEERRVGKVCRSRWSPCH